MSETTSRVVEATFKAPALQVSEWDRHRSLITRLYTTEHKPLKEVISILHEQHGFIATPRQYKQRIKAWNLSKNLKSEEIEYVLRSLPKDQLQDAIMDPSQSAVTVKGRTLRLSLLQRYLRRTRVSQTPKRCSPASSTRPQSDASSSHGSFRKLPQAQTPLPDNCNESAPGKIQLLSTLPSQPQTSCSITTSPHHVSQSSHEFEMEDDSFLAGFKRFSAPSTTEKRTNLSEEGDDDARRKRRRVPARNMASSTGTKTLACPFYKHDPQKYNPQNDNISSAMRYRTCAGPGWESISRLRQHLFRAHIAAKHCPRCNLTLHSRSEIENHAQDGCSDQLIDLNSSPEAISEEQQRQLRRKQPSSLTKEDSWLRMYGILFPHDSNIPSPYYQSDKERSKDATHVSLSLDQPSPETQQIDCLVRYLCRILPDKVLNRLQGQPKAESHSIWTETLNATTLQFAENPIQQCSRTHNEPHTEAHSCNTGQYSATEEGLKTVISEGVLETCSEWLRTRMEQDDDSDEEKSEYENEQSRSSSSLQDLSLAPITTVPDQWNRYAETQTPGDHHLAPSSTVVSDYWSQPIFDFTSCARNLNATTGALLGSTHMQLQGKRLSLPSAQPGWVHGGIFDGPAGGTPGDWIWSSTNLSADPSTS
ncbi:hypothetical protein EPUS_06007 [Endocarpon pusillum Z07020]|uniref:Clr5 domain-containing protein n=1 Tax=Endocarpon pusillum (strain Z07020 / HMAS-L-300199) TaxID=1263415 RepID=U1GGF4_ENDPU|nr:uncharacterized protein EPUS_06007 [Endocarpon pusillum Z07020]ERF71178.1 hypothetical protein EPUS_06007 [Endocarpon pusillum Z07020]